MMNNKQENLYQMIQMMEDLVIKVLIKLSKEYKHDKYGIEDIIQSLQQPLSGSKRGDVDSTSLLEIERLLSKIVLILIQHTKTTEEVSLYAIKLLIEAYNEGKLSDG